MKFTKLVHNEKLMVEYVTAYKGNEGAHSSHNSIYEVSSMSPDATEENLFVYVDNIRRYADTENKKKDFIILENKKVKFNYPIKNDSSVKLTVTEKISKNQ